MMYDRTFDTDWESLDRESAIERAFALGVAAACGSPNRSEYERIRTSMETVYDRSIVELAYEEGRSKATGLERRGEPTETIWETLVADEIATADGGGYRLESHVPGAIVRAPLLSRSQGLPGSLELPGLLRHEKTE